MNDKKDYGDEAALHVVRQAIKRKVELEKAFRTTILTQEELDELEELKKELNRILKQQENQE